MHLDKHRAISYCGFSRCHDLIPELQDNNQYQAVFYPLWMGNWLTDMNQATAFFSFLPHQEQPGLLQHWLSFLKKLHAVFPETRWLKRYIDRKEGTLKHIRHAARQEKTDYYQSRKDGTYILPDFIEQNTAFKTTWENLFATLWQDEWHSAEEAWGTSHNIGELSTGLPMATPLHETNTPAVTPGTAEEIGAYYPLDHFDVTNQYIIQEGVRVLDDREELELKNHAEQGFMASTALEALEYAKQDWLKKAFEATQDGDRAITCKNRLNDYQALKILGHGLHTLQDFYSHSNYSELLLICMAEQNLLDPYWNQRIQHLVHNTAIGTFNAFVLCKDSPDDQHGSGEKTPVVTGRFDSIDTVHTLLHLAIESIHSHNDETNHDEKEKKDRIVGLLFGTFSEIDVVQKMRGNIEAYRTFTSYIETIQDKITDFFMEYLIDPFVKKALHSQETLVNAYLLLKDATMHNDHSLQEYRKAGEMLFHQHTIENHLRKTVTKAEQAGKIILPHHALLAKDHDKGNDAVKLSYKLSCALAAEASTEVLVKYFQGAAFSELEPLLARRYVHPKFHREQCAATGSLNRTIQNLQGKKWFQHAVQNPENGQSILGFDTKAALNN
jgi:hypothetical protein